MNDRRAVAPTGQERRAGAVPGGQDRYLGFASSRGGRAVVKRLGLPDPPRLRRYQEGAPLLAGPVLLGGAGRLAGPIAKILAGLDADVHHPDTETPAAAFGALVFDATGITAPDE